MNTQDLKIHKNDRDLGSYRIYREYKYQPGFNRYYFKAPGSSQLEWVTVTSLEGFKEFVDSEIEARMAS